MTAEPIIPAYIVNLLAQIPVVVIFIWFVLKLTASYQAAQDKRDEQWRDFLREQREANNKATARLAEEIKELGKQTYTQSQILMQMQERSRG